MRSYRCGSCGGMVAPSSRRCDRCGGVAGLDGDATSEARNIGSALALVAVERADRMRAQLALAPGESALLLTRGPGAGSSFRLGRQVVTIGRTPSATILLDDVSVSRRHAEIRPDDGRHRIVDLGSLNGTYVNLIQVDEALLDHGDDIQIGLFKLCFVSGTVLRSHEDRWNGG